MAAPRPGARYFYYAEEADGGAATVFQGRHPGEGAVPQRQAP